MADEKLTPQQIANINEMEYYKVHGYKCIGDMLVNIPMIDIRGLQIYMYETYGVGLNYSCASSRTTSLFVRNCIKMGF